MTQFFQKQYQWQYNGLEPDKLTLRKTSAGTKFGSYAVTPAAHRSPPEHDAKDTKCTVSLRAVPYRTVKSSRCDQSAISFLTGERGDQWSFLMTTEHQKYWLRQWYSGSALAVNQVYSSPFSSCRGR